MRLARGWHARSLMIVVAIAAVLFYADILRRRRVYYLERARQAAPQAYEELIAAQIDRVQSSIEVVRADQEFFSVQQKKRDSPGWNDVREAMDRELLALRLNVEKCQVKSALAESNLARKQGLIERAARLQKKYEAAAARPWIVLPSD